MSEIGDILNRKFKRALAGLPPVIGAEAVNWSQERFVQQNWIGSTEQPWQPRIYNRKGKGRAILIQSGRLWRSIRIISTEEMRVTIGTDVPYAAIHNYGGQIHQAARSETFTRNRKVRGINKGQFKRGTSPGRGFTLGERVINMPQRQFIGSSPDLIRRLNEAAQRHISKQLT
jgi:phage gpG-like protein